MSPIIYYLMQVTVASGILYGYYHFALRNKLFHDYNRFYLLFAMGISLIVPFLNIPVYFSTEKDTSIVLDTLVSISAGMDKATSFPVTGHSGASLFTLKNIIYTAYWILGIIILSKIIFSLLNIRRITHRHPSEKLGNINFVNSREPGTPFSFFNWLFWNKDIDIHSKEGEQVFKHEIFHIRQRHSLDIVFLELITAVFWINPFFHLMKKELKAIHEFLADQFAVKEHEKWSYAELLLMQVLQTKQSLVNPFFHNHIKRRIAMITTSTKPGSQYFRKLMLLPLAILVTTLFAFTYKTKKENPSVKTQELDQSSPIATIDTVPAGNKTKEIKPAEYNDQVYEKMEIEPMFPGGETAWQRYVEKKLDMAAPLKNGAPDGIYKVLVQFIVDKEGSISKIRSLTKHGFGMEEQAIRLIADGPKWLSAYQDGKKVKAYHTQAVFFIVGNLKEKLLPAEKKPAAISVHNSLPAKIKNDNSNTNENINSVNNINPNDNINSNRNTDNLQLKEISVNELRKINAHELIGVDKSVNVDFVFSINMSNGIMVKTGNKDQFSATTVDLINNARTGNTITIENIHLLIDGKEKKMPGKIYKLVD
jgi:beta-lactamase regulating signal transducer with metallopeptidase domain